jgi:sugar transferase (PEP-CTERM/EpsH1 system associated)
VKILVVSPWFPYPAFGGALTRVFETLRHLARDHRVTLLAPVGEARASGDVEAISSLGVEVVAVPVSEAGRAVARRLGRGLLHGRPLIQGLHYDAAMAWQVHELTARQAFDVIHVEHSFMASYVGSISPESTARTVLSMHNIESLRFRREMHVARWGLRRLALANDHFLFRTWEERAIRQFNGIAAVSALEQAWVRQHAPAAEVAVVPNGVSLEFFQPITRTAARRNVVFAGLMNYPPNVDAVVWFCESILPLIEKRYPDVVFSVVGDKPTAEVQSLARFRGVEVTGRVPDVRPYFANADALVVPLRSGAGTRLKILEAMAMRRPVVSTRQGTEGLAVTPGANILLGDTAAELADQICTLLSDASLGNRMGREGRRLVERSYDWPLCFRPLDDLYRRVEAMPTAREAVLYEAAR